MQKKILIVGLLLLLVYALIAGVMIVLQRPFPIDLGIRHLMNITVYSEKLCTPIIKEKFVFTQVQYSRTFQIKPKFLDYYEVSIASDKNVISRGFKINGKLAVTVYKGKKIVYETISDTKIISLYSDTDSDYYKAVVFCIFPLTEREQISVKVTVLEPIKGLEKLKDSLEIEIAPSCLPYAP